MAGELYDLYEPTGEERRAAILEALRGKIQGQEQAAGLSGALGGLGMLTGDKVLSRFGQAQLADANDLRGLAQHQEQALAHAGETRLERAMRARELEANRQWQGEQKALDRQVRAEELRQRGLDRALQREMMGGARAQARTDKQDQQTDKQVESLSKRLEAAPGMSRDIGTLAAAAGQEDIPGVGPVAGRLPDWLVSDEGVKVRQAARGVVRNVIHETSGTAASDAEVERIMQELGMKQSASENQYRLGLEGLADKTRSLLRGKEAGYSPEAVAVARERGMTTSQDVPAYKAPNGVTVQEERVAPDGRVIQLLSDGTKRVKP